MIIIFYGTSAELIKMLGIVKKTPRSEQYLICTAQHEEGLKKLHAQVGIKPDLYLAHGWQGKDVANIRQMLGMMCKVHWNFLRHSRRIKKYIKTQDTMYGTKTIGLVHGDTLSTVVGAYLIRLLGYPVAHVEAGLRSGKWNNPFPEEMDRRIVAKIARLHFSPNDTAEQNLRREHTKGQIVNTAYNTSKDSIDMAAEFTSNELQKLNLPKKYTLVLLHRTELIENKSDFEAILAALSNYASKKTPIVFTKHTTTMEKIEQFGLGHYLDNPGIVAIPKQPYFNFMHIVKGAEAIVADSGGLQEDAYFLGIPIIVHRSTTERQEGLGTNAAISRLDVSKVESFLRNHKNKTEFTALKGSVSPSAVVVESLRKNKYITNA